MNIHEATEIVVLEKFGKYEGNGEDLKEALTIAYICMSYCGH